MLEIDLLKKFLGKPKKINYDSTKATFNCPRCKEENGYKFDDKYNLEINLNNSKKKFKFKKICHCWSCGLSGPIQQIFKYHAPTHIKDEFYSFGVDNPYVLGYTPDQSDVYAQEQILQLPKEFISFTDMNIQNKEHLEAFTYLTTDRKLSLDQLKFYRLGFCTEGKFAKKIIIPSYNHNGRINYFLSRSYEKFPTEKHRNCDGDKTKIIFNEHLVNWNETVYLTEGMFDLFALPINSIPLLGKELTDDFYIFKLLVKYKPKIVLCLDEDAQKRAKDIKKLLESYGLIVKMLKISNKDLAKNFEDSGKKSIITLLSTKK
jgi:hypothetical protein